MSGCRRTTPVEEQGGSRICNAAIANSGPIRGVEKSTHSSAKAYQEGSNFNEPDREQAKIDSLINEWELGNIIRDEFKSLSDGQKRRALLARALVYEPNILVLDEPFCNLDIKIHHSCSSRQDDRLGLLP